MCKGVTLKGKRCKSVRNCSTHAEYTFCCRRNPEGSLCTTRRIMANGKYVYSKKKLMCEEHRRLYDRTTPSLNQLKTLEINIRNLDARVRELRLQNGHLIQQNIDLRDENRNLRDMLSRIDSSEEPRSFRSRTVVDMGSERGLCILCDESDVVISRGVLTCNCDVLHNMCSGCIVRWVRTQQIPTCPLCRTAIYMFTE